MPRPLRNIDREYEISKRDKSRSLKKKRNYQFSTEYREAFPVYSPKDRSKSRSREKAKKNYYEDEEEDSTPISRDFTRPRDYEPRGRRGYEQFNSGALQNAGYKQIFTEQKPQAPRTPEIEETPLENPLFGFSEGHAQKQLFQKELIDHYQRSQKSSKSRSRSKSKLHKLK